MKKVVFVCHGNYTRSPIAKALYNSMATDGSHAESYGTSVEENNWQGTLVTEGPRHSTDYMAILKKHGLDISHEHATQLYPEHVADAYKIIVMADKEFIPKWLTKYEYWDIPNPDIVTPEITEQLIGILKEKITTLLSKK